MPIKIIILAAFVAVASAGNLRTADFLLPSSSIAIDGQYARLAPAEAHYVASEGSNPAYEFKYGVHDQFTGDSKSAHEIRNGDFTQGTYSLNDPDGTRRTVDYTSTPLTGFQATVRKEPLVEAVLPAAEPILAKTLVEAPAAVELRSAPLISNTLGPAVELRSAPLISNTIAPAAVELRSAPLLKGASYITGPDYQRSYALHDSSKIVRSNLHLAPEIRYTAPYAAPLVRYGEPLLRHAAPVAITRNDAGLIAPVAAGFATAGVRSYTTHTGPVLYNNW